MTMGRSTIGKHEVQLSLPLGVRIVDALCELPISDVRVQLDEPGVNEALEIIEKALSGPFRSGFMHSAICAMSLPARRPKDDTQPLVRQDGNYSLVITPRRRFEPSGPDGQLVEVIKGVPYGAMARLIIFYIMSEAVRTQSAEVFLGKNFSQWMRRMGFTSLYQGGSRSVRALVHEQLDRLMSCEWTLRYDGPPPKKRQSDTDDVSPTPFFVTDMRVANTVVGLRARGSDFIGSFTLSPEFFASLMEHSVPLAENAVRALKHSAHALDLYAWLAYRLPRIPEGKTVRISWDDLSAHFGSNVTSITKFRQMIRAAWSDVACAYPQARHSVDFSGLSIKLSYADAPTKGQLSLLDNGMVKQLDEPVALESKAGKAKSKSGPVEVELLDFPSSPLRWGAREEKFRAIALDIGGGWDVETMASKFRAGFKTITQKRTEEQWISVWTSYCRSYGNKRSLS